MRALSHVLVLAFLAIAVVYAIVFLGLGGRAYYGTALTARGYAAGHRLLRPSGQAGLGFGIAGLGLILVAMVYTLRKKIRSHRAGSMKVWLEVHIFCGIVGPALITLHTSFKFNGLISVAYWSMVVVVLSGFVGRYLYVRIPKTLRGAELSVADLEGRAEEIKSLLRTAGLSAALLESGEFGAGAARRESFLPGLLIGDLRARWRARGLTRRLREGGVAPTLLHEAVRLASEREALLRRIALLGRTKKLFDLWHVLHRPLVYVMLAIATLHVIVAVYFGYSPGRVR